MIKPLTYDNVLKLHIEKFLVEPVVTGVNFFDSKELTFAIIESIEQGKPYVEDDVPDGVLI
tara:strand:+ start:2130 stop:2312 length:183 start_codon:yes stop_codon:yes gene_type:complete